MNVANKGIIRNLTIKFLKSARTRNIMATIAIALTSLMFTSVFTLGGNMLATIQDQTMRQVGTRAHGGLKYLTMEQYENIAASSLIRDISYRKNLAVAVNEGLAKEYTEISYVEDKYADWMFTYPTVGDMPRAVDEIATSTIVLDALGIPHQLGVKVPLAFTVAGVQYNDEFSLSGYWNGDSAMVAQHVFLSKEYVDSVVSIYEPENDFIAGAISADLWFSNSFNVEDKILRLIDACGYADGEINFGVNWAYAMSGDVDPAMVAIMVIVLVLILLSGYLIIYSVFAISVKTDIHFYGLLKTIGTTGTQLRRIVRGQAFVLSAVGIPIGLLLGYFSGVLFTPILLRILSFHTATHTNSASPLIFIFAAVFSLLTVFISCRKPGKMAARVSPVEAVKYSGVTTRQSKKSRRTHKVTPLSMAWSNITQEKRRLCIIVLSLSLSLILLNGAVSASRSFDMDVYMSNYAISDFSITDVSIVNPIATYRETEGIKQDFLNELAALNITETGMVYYNVNINHKLTLNALENLKAQFEANRSLLERHYQYSIPLFEQRIAECQLETQIYGLGELPMANFYPGYEKLASGNYAISIAYNNPVYDVGDTITLTNKEEESRAFEIMAVVKEYPHSISAKYSFIPGQEIILADNIFADFFTPSGAMYINLNVEESRLPEIEKWMAEYTTHINPTLSYVSRATLKSEFEGLQATYLTIGGAMAFVLALVGILNFINTVVASVIARRRELAMLQSVGMTGKQMRETLFFEGICYTVLTALFTFTAGVGISWMIVRVIAGQTWFFKEYLTIMPSVYCIIPLLLICMVVPLVCYRWLKRERLVERLRVE